MDLLSPADFPDYELIDTGGREKLERFGKYILIRPEPQAVWRKAFPEEEWARQAHARFTRGKSLHSKVRSHQSAVTSPQSRVTGHESRVTNDGSRVTGHGKGEERGEWIRKPGMPDQWWIGYRYREMQMKLRLGLTAFGHIGIFPEQAENWKFVYDVISQMSGQADKRTGGQGLNPGELSGIRHPASGIRYPASRIRILNLFAYTGGASLAARAAGADVVHVDSVKQVISWAREDMEASGLDGIRWVAEDALTFVRREVKRGNRYDGIILDPPAYGRGPEGEKWLLEESIDEMIALCARLLSRPSATGCHPSSVASPTSPVTSYPSPVTGSPGQFLILSLYSMGFSSLIGESLLRSHFGPGWEIQSGEFCFTDRAGRRLPLGTFTRIH